MTSTLPARPASGTTARRLEWQFLPPHIRALVEEHCGSPVVRADSQGGGFAPGFASVLTCEDGTQHFVKAASVKAQRMFALSYREEARKLGILQELVPAPRLLWSHDDDWVVLGFEYVDAHLPARPWQRPDLDRLLDALEAVADVEAPADLALDLIEEDLADLPAYWDVIRERHPSLAHADEAADLAAGFAEALRGGAVQHTDIRDDNTLLGPDGALWICDWNWPVLGAPWFDTLSALIGPRGDGLDVEAVLASRRLTRDVPPAHVDSALALLAGHFLKSADDPVPSNSPHMRASQAWQGAAVWSWLSERRNW
ncbi:hypothetical protein [Nocardioides sp. Root151]|uniref:hypothetical protein n=1 Tax=Nocardioides sp. Root151 TaxID=1736475 RepID=UPI0007032656|nr:hypothetical protein [Nocardioides sp. Root151]KQZ66448.1 hypothetical protein ASD66_23275 [Nocardioides sp. Root151]